MITSFFLLQVSNEVGGGETVARVSALDAEMKRRVEAARGAGKVLRYVIKVECNGANGREEATAGIREVEMNHPYAGLKGAAFCVMYQTKVQFPRPKLVWEFLRKHLRGYHNPLPPSIHTSMAVFDCGKTCLL